MTEVEAWPLQPVPLTAYTTYGLNLLTTGQLQHIKDKQKLQLPPVAPTLQTSTNFVHFLTPQLLTNRQHYFPYNSGLWHAPFGQYYIPQPIANIPIITQNIPSDSKKVLTVTTAQTITERPRIKDREPTTKKPQGTLQFRPPKLQVKPEKIMQQMDDFKNDVALLKAVEKINNAPYVIEEIINVPGEHVLSTKSTEAIKSQQNFKKPSTLLAAEHKRMPIQLVKKSVAQKKFTGKSSEPRSLGVKVEAIGKTATKGSIPEIDFGSHFLPYFSQNQMQQQTMSSKKTAALILEPHSKAIVGNGGTAISTPISKAFLKRGVTTNVYFNPESVAIAGVGGKAHAQADLELDLIN